VAIDMRLRPPRGGYLACDIYTHPGVRDPRVYRPTHQLGMARPASAIQQSMELLLQEMDEAGVTTGVVMGRQSSPPHGWVPNDDVASIVRDYPGRFVGFAGIDLSDRKAAAREIDRAVGELEMKGVCLEPAWAVRPMYVDDPYLYPIYEKLESMQIVLSISTGGLCIASDISYSNPIPLQKVARAFPDLKLIVSHAAWPWVYQMLGIAFMCPNIYISPDMYLAVPNTPGALEYVHAANYYLGDRLLFGTAYPAKPLKPCVDAVKKLPFAEGVVERVLHHNAARLLGIE